MPNMRGPYTIQEAHADWCADSITFECDADNRTVTIYEEDDYSWHITRLTYEGGFAE